MIRIFFIGALTLGPQLLWAQGTAVPVSGDVRFEAVGKPGFIRINGTGGKLEGRVNVAGDKVNGTVQCQLKNFTTDMDLRDEHMKDKYLEVGKYPIATLVLDAVKLTKGEEEDFTGKLSLHGVTKQVAGEASLQEEAGGTRIFKARFSIELPDYNIHIPSYAGIKVAEEVRITVEGRLGQKQ